MIQSTSVTWSRVLTIGCREKRLLNEGSEAFPQTWRLRKGDLVEVRTAEEILATLAEDGTLDCLPFMPEMLEWCGQRLQVASSAHKLCDTVHKTGARHMLDAVHLEGVRCNGVTHGGCQAECLIIWKEAWLKPVEPARQAIRWRRARQECTRETLRSQTQPRLGRYRCQATELPSATRPRKYWNPCFYWEDWRSGNVRLLQMLTVLLLRGLVLVQSRIRRGYRLSIWTYDRIARTLGLPPFPYRTGTLQGATPTATLDLQPGELVRVKSHEEILKTLSGWKNRGMRFDPEMVPWCGQTFRVRKRIERIINESTGELLHLKNDCILLEGPYCLSFHSHRRLFCSRAILPYWREIWLERVEEAASASSIRDCANCPSTVPFADSTTLRTDSPPSSGESAG